MPVTTRSASAEAKTKMRLRSGKILRGVANDKNKVEDNVYKLSVVEEAKNQVRQQVKARGREIAEHHIQRSINNTMHVLNSYVVAFNEIDNVGCDPVMEKIRLIEMMYAYANSVSIHTMMHDNLKKLREILLKQCARFTDEAKVNIDKRIKVALEILPGLDHERYYTIQLENMQSELDQFTNTYIDSV